MYSDINRQPHKRGMNIKPLFLDPAVGLYNTHLGFWFIFELFLTPNNHRELTYHLLTVPDSLGQVLTITDFLLDF